MSKHTKGPWKVVYEEPNGDPKHSIYTSNDVYVASVPVGFYHGGLKLHEHEASKDSEANARLIAAAPELLAALKHSYDYIESARKDILINHQGDPNLEIVLSALKDLQNLNRLAIAKAEGENE